MRQKLIMKARRTCDWRCVRITIVWCIFLLVVYWYHAKERQKPLQRKYTRLDRSDIARARIVHAPRSNDILNSLQVIDRNTYITSDDLKEIKKSDSRNGTTNYKEMIRDIIVGYQLPSSTSSSFFIANKQFDNNDNDGVETEYDDGKISNTKDNNNSNDGRNQHLAFDNEEDPGAITPLGDLIVSSLREQIGNPLVLKSNRLHWTISMVGSYSAKLFSPPPKESPKQRLPQAIIIGFGKCGTRALISFLSMHPYVVTAGPEVHFFDIDENFQKGLRWYRQQMPVSYSNQVTIEKTPSYIVYDRAIHEIYKLSKEMKLIVLVKDPVSRLVSQSIRSNTDITTMCLVVKDGQLKVNNESRTVQWSIYVNYLRRWMERFPLSQIHVTEADEFIQHPAKELQKLEVFLGVPRLITENNFYFNKTKGFYCKRPFHTKGISCLPEGKGRKHPNLPPVIENTLYEFFRGYNEDLFRLLGRRFDWEPTRKENN